MASRNGYPELHTEGQMMKSRQIVRRIRELLKQGTTRRRDQVLDLVTVERPHEPDNVISN